MESERHAFAVASEDMTLCKAFPSLLALPRETQNRTKTFLQSYRAQPQSDRRSTCWQTRFGHSDQALTHLSLGMPYPISLALSQWRSRARTGGRVTHILSCSRFSGSHPSVLRPIRHRWALERMQPECPPKLPFHP